MPVSCSSATGACYSLMHKYVRTHTYTHTVHDTVKLTFSTSVQAFSLLAYADVPKENDSHSVLFHVGVASCMCV